LLCEKRRNFREGCPKIMQDLKIAFYQGFIPWEDTTTALERWTTRLNGNVPPAQLLLLPEMFSTGFSMKVEILAESMQGPSVTWMQEHALKRKVYIAGTLMIKEDHKYFNRLIMVNPSGEIIATYDKRHLFSPGNENQHFTPGTEPCIIEVEGWKIACFICYDLRFPVWSRNKNLTYDAAIYLANWPEKRISHWRALLLARAIENQAYVVGVNRTGKDGNGVPHSGDSILVSPYGEIMVDAGSETGWCYHQLSAEKLTQYREQFPIWRDAD